MTFPRIKLKLFLIPVFVTSLFFISCQDKNESKEEVTEVSPEASLEQKRQQLNNVVPAASRSTNTSAASGALNPPHGQPNHRCDIAVGAPLDGSSPVKVAPAQSNPMQIQSNSASGAAPADGLNPPHGQPGHRCDIKVGDPL